MKHFIILLTISLFLAGCKDNDEPLPQNPSQTKESVIITTDFNITIDENPEPALVLGTISASTDSDNPLKFSIGTQTPSGALTINSETGVLSVADYLAFNYEANPTITATVRVTDDISEKIANVNINLNDISIIWSGDRITFTKINNADFNLEENQDRITENVWLTRADSDVLINMKGGSGCAPENVQLAYGTTAELPNLVFSDCMKKLEGSALKDLPGKDVVFFLVLEDIYIDVHFTAWTSGQVGGGFAYERTTPN